MTYAVHAMARLLGADRLRVQEARMRAQQGERRYPRESQEMVFDAHHRSFAFFHGTCQRGIYEPEVRAATT